MSGSVRAVTAILWCRDASATGPKSQNALHAAVLQCSAMKGHASIISHAAKNRMLEHHLNAQDRDGNTPLHLTVSAGEYNVVSKLLSSGKVQTHIMNNAGCTPSDLVKDCKGFYSMVRLVVKMYVSGVQFQPQRQDQIEKWNGQDIMKWRETTSKNLAVVSTLVATVAFSAAFNVPGSYGDDGKAILTGDRMYDAFLVLDTFAVVSSVTATILLVYGRASQSNRSWVGFMISMHFLWMSLNSMVLGFFTAMAAVTNKKVGTKTAMSQMIYFGMYFLRTDPDGDPRIQVMMEQVVGNDGWGAKAVSRSWQRSAERLTLCVDVDLLLAGLSKIGLTTAKLVLTKDLTLVDGLAEIMPMAAEDWKERR
ncbi:hypothetical protein OsI_35977 [Oryza sativa Indica Group]|uniref:PGG domain-containing protein n=1 Tax=Oryza sativa subsp. indica TaxID=39946 RepID=B8BKB1_ORYSI|nr:hypothetical protein OsI_35977 [Oryza sativa Indica Group]